MNNGELDRLIEDALNSERVPPELNERLLLRAGARQKRKKRFITAAVRGTSAAAVFICAAAVISNFNSDIKKQTEMVDNEVKVTEKASGTDKSVALPDISEKAQNQASEALPDTKNEAVKEKTEAEKEPDSSQAAPQKEEKIISSHKEATENAETAPAVSEEGAIFSAAYESSEPALTDAAPQTASETEIQAAEEAIVESIGENTPAASDDTASPRTFKNASGGSSGGGGGGSSAPLSSHFNDGYDFCTAIYTKIAGQMEAFPEGTFFTGENGGLTSITGNESYRLEYDGSLFIIFPPGVIAPGEMGRFEFFVGRIENGILN